MSLTDQNRLADFILETTYPLINRLDINPVLRRKVLTQNLSSLDSSVSTSHRRANRRIILLRLLIRSTHDLYLNGNEDGFLLSFDLKKLVPIFSLPRNQKSL